MDTLHPLTETPPLSLVHDADRLTLRQRFDRHTREDASGCLVWTGAAHKGTPRFAVAPGAGGTVDARKAAMAWTHGYVAPSQRVESVCGNKLCLRHVRIARKQPKRPKAVRRLSVETKVLCAELFVAGCEDVPTLMGLPPRTVKHAIQWVQRQLRAGRMLPTYSGITAHAVRALRMPPGSPAAGNGAPHV